MPRCHPPRVAELRRHGIVTCAGIHTDPAPPFPSNAAGIIRNRTCMRVIAGAWKRRHPDAKKSCAAGDFASLALAAWISIVSAARKMPQWFFRSLCSLRTTLLASYMPALN